MIQPPFEAIRHTFDTTDYWSASELGVVLGYPLWPDMQIIVQRAMASCTQKGHDPQDHFNYIVTHYSYTPGGQPYKKEEEYWLSWYACYLILRIAHQHRPTSISGSTYFAGHKYRTVH